MPLVLTSDQVWQEIKKQIFVVLGTVTSRGQPRTTGIVYVVRDRQLYIAAFRATWKVRNILADPHVSLTVTIPKRIPFCPWIKIPSATITFQGQASITSLQETPEEIQKALMEDLKISPEARSNMCFIKVRPEGRFLTYGVGTSLRGMLNPEQAIAHTPV